MNNGIIENLQTKNYLRISGNIHLSYFVEAADLLDIEYEIIVRGLLAKFSYKNKHWYIANTATPLTNSPSSMIAKRKSLTNTILNQFGLPIPKQYSVRTPQEAIERYLELKKIVIKPLQALGGHGVSISPGYRKLLRSNIIQDNSDNFPLPDPSISQDILVGSTPNNKDILGGSTTDKNPTDPVKDSVLLSDPQCLQDIETAYKFAVENNKSNSPENVLVEEFIEGENYRLLVLDNEVIGIVHRVPAYIIGDGESTIQQLITAQNSLRNEKMLLPIPMDTELQSKLQTHGFDLNSITPKDQKIFLRYNANLTTGGTTEECASIVNPYYKDLAVRAVKAIGLKYGGLDLITPDITKPAKCAINEINYNPGLRLHYKPDAGNIVKVAIPIMKFIRDNDI